MTEDNHDKELPTDKGWEKRFDQCPCGSTERFYENILNELKSRGLIDTKVDCFGFQLQQGFPLPPQKMSILPYGSEIPHFKKIVDTCCSCGLEYAVVLSKQMVRKSLDLASPQIPFNRAERRRAEKFNPNMNNPMLS